MSAIQECLKNTNRLSRAGLPSEPRPQRDSQALFVLAPPIKHRMRTIPNIAAPGWPASGPMSREIGT